MAADDTDLNVHSTSGRVLTVIIALLAVGYEVSAVALREFSRAEIMAPRLVLFIVLAWLLFWMPRVRIARPGITVINPFRTHEVPWDAVTGTESRWALTLTTTAGPITAWAVPRTRPGAMGVEMRRDPRGMPDYAAQQQFERQSAGTSSSSAAEITIARQLQRRDSEGSELQSQDSIRTSWHRELIVIIIVLAIASIVAAFVIR